MEESKNEQVEIELGDNEIEETVEVETPAEETEATDGVEAASDEQETESTKDSDPEKKAEASEKETLDEYSGRVKKRIDKLTARLRESERREQSAIEYAKSIQSQHENLQEQYNKTSSERRDEARGRVETQIMSLKNVIKRAKEEGDIDTETEAHARLTTALWEQRQLSEDTVVPQAQPQAQPVPAPQPPQNTAPRPDPKAEEWAERNEWFGRDVVMTNTVRGIHVELVKNEGFDPSSDEYYDEIDRRIRTLFPKQFQEEVPAETAPQADRTNRPVQTVAPATRSSGVNSSARRKIKLKPSEVAIAKTLGVPLEEYAKHVKR